MTSTPLSFELPLRLLERCRNGFFDIKAQSEDAKKSRLATIRDLLHCMDNEMGNSTRELRERALTPLANLSNFMRGTENRDILRKIETLNMKMYYLNRRPHSGPPCKIVLVLGDDHNGAVAMTVRSALFSNIPFITTRSIVGANGIKRKQAVDINAFSLAPYLLPRADEWNIYQQIDKLGQEQHLIFLPKSLTLDSLDLEQNSRDHYLVSISAHEALNGPHHACDHNSIFTLFKQQPDHDKLFLVAAHGQHGQPLGMADTEFSSFMNLLSIQRCKALTMISCFSGGLSTLKVLPNCPGLQNNRRAKFGAAKRNKVDFPVLVRSIGNLPTTTFDFIYTYHDPVTKVRNYDLEMHSAECDVADFFCELETVLNKKGGKTVPEMRKAIKKVEQFKEKPVVNSNKIYFPRTPDSPEGFKILEENDVYSLTYLKLQALQLGNQFQRFQQGKINPSGQLRIEGKSALVLHPTVIRLEIILADPSLPIIMSGIPGRAHHFIKSLTVACEFQEFIDYQFDFNRQFQRSADEAIFIERLVCQKKVYHNVVIHFQESKMHCAFRDAKGIHRWFENQIYRKISKFTFAVEALRTARCTTPLSASIRYSTGGQQGIELFKRAAWRFFFDCEFEPFKPENLATMTPENAVSLTKKLLIYDRGMFAFHLIVNSRNDLAELLVESNLVPPDSMTPGGFTLLGESINRNISTLAILLLQKGANPNIEDSLGLHPLSYAMSKRNDYLVHYLLDHPDIDINIKNKKGTSPVGYGLDYLELLTKKKAEINAFTNLEGSETLLSDVCRFSFDFELKVRLLNSGANPNLGCPAPLESAAVQGDKRLISALVFFGADPTIPDGLGRIPLHEIVRNGSRNCVTQLLVQEKFGSSVNKKNHLDRTLLDEAYERGDSLIYWTLLTFLDDPAPYYSRLIKLAIQDANMYTLSNIRERKLNPYTPDDHGMIPFIEAMKKKTHRHIVEMIRMTANWIKEDHSYGKNILYQSIDLMPVQQTSWLVKIVLENGGGINLEENSARHIAKKLFCFAEDFETIRLFAAKHRIDIYLQQGILEAMCADEFRLKKNGEIIRRCIEEGIFSAINAPVKGGATLFSILCFNATTSPLNNQNRTTSYDPARWEALKPAVESCLEKNANVNGSFLIKPRGIPRPLFRIVLESRNVELIHLMSTHGLDKRILNSTLRQVQITFPELYYWFKSAKL